ncbi:MAG: CDF family Co(II)/Ni(II) efflux transporter DmeF [Rhodospirillaceae bacterium]|nr:CDF family Co(II)/Ni(II) efflux transporter DmeF [Rhodospirillales bacterium]
MHTEDLSAWTHDHRFQTGTEAGAERRTKAVAALTIAMMVAEITVGMATNSMALLADGFHMSTHAGALGIAAFAYWHARKHADDRRYTFGTGKVGTLAAFTSAIILGMVALLMVWESGNRLLAVQAIGFDEALWVAVLGLAVNVVSAFILGGGHGHDHHDDHGHHHGHHHDHNLRAAYVHVLADAFTSVLAIAALLFGKYLGWWWLDPVMGIVGAVVIAKWAWTLVGKSGGVLLDKSDDGALEAEVRDAIEAEAGNRVADLHLWQIGPGHWAAIVAIVTHTPRSPQHYRTLLGPIHELSHVTIEVDACDGAP